MSNRHSIFPAEVWVGVHNWRNAHVRIDLSNRVQVWTTTATYPHRLRCVLDDLVSNTIQDYNRWAPLRERTAEFMLTKANTPLRVAAQSGCGCGSPLRSLPQWHEAEQYMAS